MALSTLLDPVMRPLLLLNPLFAIVLISFLISFFIVLIYKKLTDQNLMKRLKAEIKELQAEMKTLKNEPGKMMKVQKKAMETNTKYMMHSLKPTLITFIPIILIFGWLNANMAYFPLIEDQQFGIIATFEEGTEGTIAIVDTEQGLTLLEGPEQRILNNKAEWTLSGEADDYTIRYEFADSTFEHKLIITNGERKYAKPVLRPQDLGLSDTTLDQIIISNKKVQPIKNIPILGFIPWIKNFGWLGTYILFSIVFSISLRKLLKVY